ncbi:type IX secretion system plug protein [Pedobacter mendelii]|uniref:Type 9 secretion system plug protein N-terminal domain-containing protein n=1 Tax=Pedobacter mendelii TaxID=1908240 RepID=A0ABQ2BFL9_9SPHI|nr:DUF5103 domain-containing protein [Pedobacter mendelii]GGI24957.1 hypothetical protein GCM10008119_15250 [Pedobacter mendelii]
MQKLIVILLFFISTLTLAQTNNIFTNENKIYIPNIKTVLCYNSNKEQSLPVILLNSSETIAFSFDDLLAGTKNYWYTVEHCTSDWQTSRISSLDYLDGFADDRIIEYHYSSNTTRKYTHYELTLPNTQVKPKIGGNYLLKVYEDGDKNKPVISQRFYILDSQVAIAGEVTNSLQVADRDSKQKINFTINHSIAIPNPYQDLKAIVMQNFNSNTAQINTRPSFVRPNQLVYNDLNTNDFWADNEFRKFDTRSLRFKGDNVRDIFRDNESVNVMLFQDITRNTGTFANQLDENGSFFIRNTDGRDDRTEAEYMGVLFTLNASAPSKDGDAYVVGRFNNYTLNKENKLLYDVNKKQFYGNILMKQGLYDYEYIWLEKSSKTIETKPFEGAFFQTENTYQIFVYYRRPGARWETLVGYTNLSNRITDKK